MLSLKRIEELKQMINDLCKDLTYDEVERFKFEIPSILYSKLEWQPLKFYNPHKDEMIDFSDTHLVTYNNDTYEYEIKNIKTGRTISRKNGKYGAYFTIKKVNIGEWQLKQCLQYPDEDAFDKAVLLDLKNKAIKCITRHSSLELRYKVGKTQSEVSAILNKSITDGFIMQVIEDTDGIDFETIKREFIKSTSTPMIAIEALIARKAYREAFKIELEQENKVNDDIRQELKQFALLALLNSKDIAKSLNLSIDDYRKIIKNYNFNQLTDEEIKYLFETKLSYDGMRRLHYIVLSIAEKIFNYDKNMIATIVHFPWRDIEYHYCCLVESIYPTK